VCIALNQSHSRIVYLILSRVRPHGKGLTYLRRHHATAADDPRTSLDDKTTNRLPVGDKQDMLRHWCSVDKQESQVSLIVASVRRPKR